MSSSDEWLKSLLYIYTMEYYDSAWIRNRIKKIQIQEDSNWLMYITLIYNYKYMYINICLYYVFIYVCVDTCMYAVYVDHDSRKRILRREDLLKCLFILFICVPVWKYVYTCVWGACALGSCGGQRWILSVLSYHSLPCSLEAGSLIEIGCRLVSSKPPRSSCLCPTQDWLTYVQPLLAFYGGAGDLNLSPHACTAELPPQKRS